MDKEIEKEAVQKTDIQDLILVGKLGRVVSMKNSKGQCLEVRLSTPTAEDVKKMGNGELDAAEFVSYFVVRIGDREYASEEREGLREGLGKIQGTVLGFLNKQCLQLLEEQEAFVEELTKK